MACKHTFILKDGYKSKSLTGMSAIREKCLESSVWQPKEIQLCPNSDCALYPFRFGKYPKNRVAGTCKCQRSWREKMDEKKEIAGQFRPDQDSKRFSV